MASIYVKPRGVSFRFWLYINIIQWYRLLLCSKIASNLRQCTYKHNNASRNAIKKCNFSNKKTTRNLGIVNGAETSRTADTGVSQKAKLKNLGCQCQKADIKTRPGSNGRQKSAVHNLACTKKPTYLYCVNIGTYIAGKLVQYRMYKCWMPCAWTHFCAPTQIYICAYRATTDYTQWDRLRGCKIVI